MSKTHSFMLACVLCVALFSLLGQGACPSSEGPGNGPVDVVFDEAPIVDMNNITLENLGKCSGSVALENFELNFTAEEGKGYSIFFYDDGTAMNWLGMFCWVPVPDSNDYFSLYTYFPEDTIEVGTEVSVGWMPGQATVWGFLDTYHSGENIIDYIKYLTPSVQHPAPGDYTLLANSGTAAITAIGQELGEITTGMSQAYLVEQKPPIRFPEGE